MIRYVLLLVLLSSVSIGLLVPQHTVPPVALAQTDASIEITVPRIDLVDAGTIKRLTIDLTLTQDPADPAVPGTGVTFFIRDPEGEEIEIGPLSPGSPQATDEFPLAAPSGDAPGNPAPIIADTVTVNSPLAGETDPVQRRTYEIVIDLLSDRDALCNPTDRPEEETWTVGIRRVEGGPTISQFCVEAFQNANPDCSGFVPYLSGEGLPPVTVNGAAANICISRPGLDVVMVLDTSGSMNNSTLGTNPRPKIAALRDAVEDFTRTWDELRDREGSTAPEDRLGVVLFNGNAEWWEPLFTDATPIRPFDADLAGDVLSQLDSSSTGINAGGSTSIGDGLTLADEALVDASDPDRQRVILLMSNGKQNTNLHVAIQQNAAECPGGGGFTEDLPVVYTYALATPCERTALRDSSNPEKYQIYSVTVGTGDSVDPVINQGLADATGGFYNNSEVDPEELRLFFLELLQNFVQFNTWQTALLASGSLSNAQDFSAVVPVSSTSSDLVVDLLWPDIFSFSSFELRLFPPGGGDPIIRSGSDGSVQIGADVTDYPVGDWRIEVYYTYGTSPTPVPFLLTALVDDKAIDVDMRVVAGDYAPGDPIRLEARISEFGAPVLGVGTFSGDQMFAQVVKPGVAIGDLLAESEASFDIPNQDDPSSDAAARLFNALQDNPEALQRVQDRIRLRDDGSGGDTQANDGIYTGLYTSDQPGHYNFLFSIRGRSREAGFFARQQIRTTYVRPLPDRDNTVVETQVQSSGGQQTLLVSLTPRTAAGSLIPAFENYFWASLLRDEQSFKFVDPDLDGVYTVEIPFSGEEPPSFAIHFLDLPQIIGDDVGAADLPQALSQANTITVIGESFVYLPIIVR